MVAKIASKCLAIGCCQITGKHLAIRQSQIACNYLAILITELPLLI
jgi:hypothetical protein